MLRLTAVALGVFLLAMAGQAQALMVDPVSGGSGEFYWDNGAGDSVLFGPRPRPSSADPPGDDTLEILLTQNTVISLFAVTDCCVPGDSFLLIVDGSEVGWTEAGFTGDGGLFEAGRFNLALDAGLHFIDLTVSTTAPGFVSGSGAWSMSTAVPEPSSALLACVGALLLRSSLRRRKTNF
jgi:hypothetical protein